MKVLSQFCLLLLVLAIGCSSSGTNRSTAVDGERLSPPDVQPAPLAAAIPDALQVVTVAQASPRSLEHELLLREIDRFNEANAISYPEIRSPAVYPSSVRGYDPLSSRTSTNVEDELGYELQILVDDWMPPDDWR